MFDLKPEVKARRFTKGCWADTWSMQSIAWNLRYDHMGVSKNRGTPKWMVYNNEIYRCFRGTSLFLEIYI